MSEGLVQLAIEWVLSARERVAQVYATGKCPSWLEVDLAKDELAEAVLDDIGLGQHPQPPTFEPEDFKPAVQRRPTIPQWMRAYVFIRDGRICRECQATDDITIDHIVPVIEGGPTTPENLRALCRSCNSSKGARML